LIAGNNPRVTIIREYTPQVATLFEDNFFDWVYIDANHSYNSIRADLMSWYKKIKSGGLLAGYDYSTHSTYYGVIQAVNEFSIEHNLKLFYLTVETLASYAIKKPNYNSSFYIP